jgi:excisionase family DNA binding protein
MWATAEGEHGSPVSHFARPEPLLTVQEVADWLRVEPSWVRAHANGNRRPILPSIKIGKFRRFIKSDVNEFLRSLPKPETSEGP